MLFTFPESERKYRECIFIGTRRTPLVFHEDAPGENYNRLYQWRYERPIDIDTGRLEWAVPTGHHPKNFVKRMYTPNELLKAVQGSPLNELFNEPKELPLPTPAMQLGPGHRSLLVICGFMNGVIKRGNDPPFVLRGTIDKEQYISEHQSANDGSSTIKKDENTINNVRCVGPDGLIKTFSNRLKPKGK